MTTGAAKVMTTVFLVAGLTSVARLSPVTAADGRKETAGKEETQMKTSTAPGTQRTDLQRHDLSAPGREVIQVRVDFDPGYVAPKHKHPGEEIIYVLKGTLEYYIEGRPPATYRAGNVLMVPAQTVHWVKNIGSGQGAELATYVVEKDKPLIELVK